MSISSPLLLLVLHPFLHPLHPTVGPFEYPTISGVYIEGISDISDVYSFICRFPQPNARDQNVSVPKTLRPTHHHLPRYRWKIYTQREWRINLFSSYSPFNLRPSILRNPNPSTDTARFPRIGRPASRSLTVSASSLVFLTFFSSFLWGLLITRMTCRFSGVQCPPPPPPRPAPAPPAPSEKAYCTNSSRSSAVVRIGIKCP
ncbi:hypothetical protein BZA05DRAFT_123889 [Tricharina praecox]|uniref:uncharacterized protein n=1 Tax=Tricharina praecox TaxID=43433 RepID=UPI00221EB21F|nr:uncharacterized protein BZA05DRAFT_123889 [Tricharina praecox]KAI5847474.1 hypothetical protein BZA05DRAFT_123889 [Tricharina praecox]